MSDISDRFWSYVEDVETGKILTNRWMKLVMKRFRQDLKKSEDPSYPYEFNLDYAERIIKFTELMKQTDSSFAGQTLKLLPWQVFIFGQIEGWRRKDNPKLRRFRKAWLYVARKNGKSCMVSSFGIWDLLSTPGSQVYLAATVKSQAKIIFTMISNMIDQNPMLSKRLKNYKSTSTIVNPANYGKLTALSADSKKTSDGLSPSMGIFDECSVSDYSIYKVIESGEGARQDSLNILISSGSAMLDSMGFAECDRAEKILEGIIEDETYFTVMFCIDKEDDWRDESKWIKANPSLGVTLSQEFLHNLKVQAEQVPLLQTEFRTKCCGEWCNPETTWINYRYWQTCINNASKYKFDINKPYYANIAIDLSKSNDLTAMTLCLYQDNKYFLKHYLYFPIDSFQDRITKETELWRRWLDKGIVTPTPGKTIDYDWLLKQIEEILSEYEVQECLIDPYNSSRVVNDLENTLTVVPIAQNLKNLSPYAKTLEKEILDGNIVDNNEVMKWCISNAKIYTDANSNIKIIKNNNKGTDVGNLHIDPVICASMCIGRIQSLLDAGEIDLRSADQVAQDTRDLLSKLTF